MSKGRTRGSAGCRGAKLAKLHQGSSPRGQRVGYAMRDGQLWLCSQISTAVLSTLSLRDWIPQRDCPASSGQYGQCVMADEALLDTICPQVGTTNLSYQRLSGKDSSRWACVVRAGAAVGQGSWHAVAGRGTDESSLFMMDTDPRVQTVLPPFYHACQTTSHPAIPMLSLLTPCHTRATPGACLTQSSPQQ